MIVKMNKVTLLVSAKERKAALKKLRRLGVLHIQHLQSPSSDKVFATESQIADVNKALVFVGEGDGTGQPGAMPASDVVSTILAAQQEKEARTTELRDKNEMMSWFTSWGKISLASVQELEKAGLFVRYYVADKDAFKKLPQDKQYITVKEDKSTVRFAYLAESEQDTLDLKEERMPHIQVEELENRIAEIETELADLDAKLAELLPYKPALEAFKAELEKHNELNSVDAGMIDQSEFAYLQGFIPDDELDALKNAADNEGWGYIIDEPDDPSVVPTVLRNKKPVAFINPLFKFMETLPGYKEFDVSLVFLAFFSLFYAMIIGDAGYGLIFLVGTIWARAKKKDAPFAPFALFYILSFATIIWGVLTGTWFGSQTIAELPILKQFVIENMYSFNESEEATRFMMNFTFTIGVVHLVIARMMAAIRKLPHTSGLADIGWALIVVGIYNVARQLVLTIPMPQWAIIMLGVGVFMVALFTNFQKNIFKAIGGSLFNVVLDTISCFSDIVSYIRLFAVGIASVMVAAAFNDMAGGLFAPLVLVFGHGLNIILGLMSVMVHGVRLNMLEFSSHLGQEWSGLEYKPFQE